MKEFKRLTFFKWKVRKHFIFPLFFCYWNDIILLDKFIIRFTFIRSEESIIIIEGELEMHLENEVLTLTEGDALRFKSDIPHTYINKGNHRTLISMVIDYK